MPCICRKNDVSKISDFLEVQIYGHFKSNSQASNQNDVYENVLCMLIHGLKTLANTKELSLIPSWEYFNKESIPHMTLVLKEFPMTEIVTYMYYITTGEETGKFMVFLIS